MGYLLAALIALPAGPLALRLVRTSPRWVSSIDGFVLVTLGGILLLEIMPSSIQAIGWQAVGVAVIGFIFPTLFERGLHHLKHHHEHRVVIALTALGLVVHALLDGAALSEHPGHSHALSLGIVLHRIPLGIALWWLAKPSLGPGGALAVLGGVLLATVGGFFLGGTLLFGAALSPLAMFQAFLAGSLVHVVIHHGLHERPEQDEPRAAGIGAMVGFAFIAAMEALSPVISHHASDAHHGIEVSNTLLVLALQSAPALLLAFAMAGILQTVLKAIGTDWLSRGTRPTQALKGMAFGLPLPLCSCGVVPVYQTLAEKRVPVAAAIAFLIATPEIGLDAILLSWPLLGFDMMLLRIAAAAVAAMAVSLLVAHWFDYPPEANDTPKASCCGPETNTTDPAAEGQTAITAASLLSGLRYGFTHLFDTTMPWIFAGLGLAVLVEPLLQPQWVMALPTGMDVVLLALIGMPGYVCASGATPLAAVLLTQGVSPGAALAFLLTGPATNATTFGVLSGVHGRRAATWFAVGMFAVSVGIGLLVNFVGTSSGWSVGVPHQHGDHQAAWYEIASLAILGVTFLVSLLRRGPRHFIDHVVASLGAGAHEHDHSHSHSHDETHAHA